MERTTQSIPSPLGQNFCFTANFEEPKKRGEKFFAHLLPSHQPAFTA